MWSRGWRDAIWSALDRPWDVLIIGGGVTGAGLLRLCTLYGLRALLIEARDFSFGTSSRSSKLVHGGFRYLRNRQFNVTFESVREREWLLRAAPHLVTPLSFVLPVYPYYRASLRQFQVGVLIYDGMALRWQHGKLTPPSLLARCPWLNPTDLAGGVYYGDARVDDSRLVLRLLREAVQAGATALSYARAVALLRTLTGRVCGAVVRDEADPQGRTLEVHARVVINATGPWTDDLRREVGAAPRLRRTRGSHLVFPQAKFPLTEAVTLLHPRDRRAMFAIPWEGVTLLGTTDLDHPPAWEDREPFATAEEITYLLEALHVVFPRVEAGEQDLLATFAGLRPIIRSGAEHPSKESRAHSVWDEQGLITITGGKLTTFRRMAQDTLRLVAPYLNLRDVSRPPRPFFTPVPLDVPAPDLDFETLAHLAGRLGPELPQFLAETPAEEWQPIPTLPNVWAEVRWAARHEGVVHLEDLLLRRVRLGLLLPNGGMDHLDRIRALVQSELGWEHARWEAEVSAYRETWQRFYSPCPTG
ncbi:glycerol-3-phosphate dehydrogenase/oxidase [uncultured Thermanaerothrix sp.]|uniref:glycerol-3-phosphate dehydrogenase/oxidase n=1 Tax=uncultured Thermanaerothrix sp. TaxID=1195149 RepID=UPI00262572C3|nr:glycerol-3-phosphate dehydrogenase/oxidase [uncultured Thermanaerothrix sp.]